MAFQNDVALGVIHHSTAIDLLQYEILAVIFGD
jgi:hypothetical protein